MGRLDPSGRGRRAEGGRGAAAVVRQYGTHAPAEPDGEAGSSLHPRGRGTDPAQAGGTPEVRLLRRSTTSTRDGRTRSAATGLIPATGTTRRDSQVRGRGTRTGAGARSGRSLTSGQNSRASSGRLGLIPGRGNSG